MSFTEQNFLRRLEGLVTGDGFIREIPVSLAACVATGADAAALSSNMLVITFDASNESISVPFTVPLDYDESQDSLAVVLTALLTTGDKSAGTNTISLDLDQVFRVRPGELKAVTPLDMSALVTSDAQLVDDVDVEQYVFDLSNLGMKPGDAFTIEIDATEAGTAVATIYGAAIRYRSDIVAFDENQRDDVTKAITNA